MKTYDHKKIKQNRIVYIIRGTRRKGILPQDLVHARSHEIRVWTFPIALTFDKHLGNTAAEMPVEFQTVMIIITSNLTAWRLREN